MNDWTIVEKPNWKVEFFPEEQEFIDFVWSRKQNQQDGRGDFIAPIRGGIIYLNDYSDYTEDQQKWIVFNMLHHPRYQVPGFQGIKFMNFNYNGKLPGVLEDPEAMDKWGVPRVTTDGQPVGSNGLPLNHLVRRKKSVEDYIWDSEKKEYVRVNSFDMEYETTDADGIPVPEKLVD